MTFHQVGAPSAQTDQAPAVVLTDFGGLPNSRVFVAWRNASKSVAANTIWYSSSTDNIHWSTPLQIRGSSWQAFTDHGPALVLSEAFSEPQELLYAAWKGEGANQIWYSSSKDGVTWSDPQTVPGAATTNKPALAQNTTAGTGGPLAVAWLAVNGAIEYALSPSGISPTWSGATALTSAGASKLAPALGSISIGSLAFSWVDNENTVWYQLPSNPPARVQGSGFTTKTDSAPSVATQTNYTGLACKGNGDSSVWIVKEFPNPPLTQQSVPGAATGYGPAWAGVGYVLAFSANNLIVDGIPVEDLTIWTCVP
jgi:hypothetical protein